MQRLRQWCRRRPYRAAAMAGRVVVKGGGPAGDRRIPLRLRQSRRSRSAAATGRATPRRRRIDRDLAGPFGQCIARDTAERDLAARQPPSRAGKRPQGPAGRSSFSAVRAEQGQALALAQREARVALARQLIDDARLGADIEPPRSLFLATGRIAGRTWPEPRFDGPPSKSWRDALAQVDPQVLPGHQAAIQAMAVESDHSLVDYRRQRSDRAALESFRRESRRVGDRAGRTSRPGQFCGHQRGRPLGRHRQLRRDGHVLESDGRGIPSATTDRFARAQGMDPRAGLWARQRLAVDRRGANGGRGQELRGPAVEPHRGRPGPVADAPAGTRAADPGGGHHSRRPLGHYG